MDRLGHETRRLFQSLRRRWLPEPDLKEGFLKSLDGYSDLQDHLRANRNLNQLSLQMYSDLRSLIVDAREDEGQHPDEATSDKMPGAGKLTLPEVHEILHIIQTMEIAWMNARMDDFDAHPMNRGWVAAFHRWAMMPAFRRAWPVLRTDFSREFIEYCESRFSLHVQYSGLEKWLTPGDQKKQVEELLDGKIRTDSHKALKLANWPDIRRTVLSDFEYEWPEIDLSFLDDRRCRVWYVCPSIRLFDVPGIEKVKRSDSKATSVSCETPIPLGFVALLPPAPKSAQSVSGAGSRSCDINAPELRFWVRPQYRFLGAGRYLLNQFALQSLKDDLPQKVRKQGSKRALQKTVWSDDSPLVTRYFVRTGQAAGHGLRRRMQLGFLYEYSFFRMDDRPYDELVLRRKDQDLHPSERGLHRDRTVNAQAIVVPTILSTTWQDFFESARAMSDNPREFKPYVPPTARY